MILKNHWHWCNIRSSYSNMLSVLCLVPGIYLACLGRCIAHKSKSHMTMSRLSKSPWTACCSLDFARCPDSACVWCYHVAQGGHHHPFQIMNEPVVPKRSHRSAGDIICIWLYTHGVERPGFFSHLRICQSNGSPLVLPSIHIHPSMSHTLTWSSKI